MYQNNILEMMNPKKEEIKVDTLAVGNPTRDNSDLLDVSKGKTGRKLSP